MVGIGILVLVAMILYKFRPMSRTLQVTNDKVFCAGVDSTTGDSYLIKFSVNIKDKGHVRVFKKSAVKEQAQPSVDEPELKFQDVVAAIEYQGPQGAASRLNLRLNAEENLQVYRECGAQPVCRIEKIHHMTPEQAQSVKHQLKGLEKDLAKANGKLKKLSALAGKMKKDNGKKVGKKVTAWNLEMRKQTELVEDLDKQVKQGKSLLESQGADIQLTNLTPTQSSDWCADVAH